MIHTHIHCSNSTHEKRCSRTVVIIKKHKSWCMANQQFLMSLQWASWPSCFSPQLSYSHSSQSYHNPSSSSRTLSWNSRSSPASLVPSSPWPPCLLASYLKLPVTKERKGSISTNMQGDWLPWAITSKNIYLYI